MNALNPLRNMLNKTGRFGAANTASALTITAPMKEARMAEKANDLYHIPSQGQPCFDEVLS